MRNRAAAIVERHGRRTIVILGVILAVGLGLRVNQALNPDPRPGIDAITYDNLARTLYEDHRYGAPGMPDPTDWSPGAPLLYSSVYFATGGYHPTLARLLVALIGAVTILVVYLLGRRIAGRSAGLVAAGLVAVYPAFIYDAGRLMSEPPAALALASSVLAMLWAADKQSGSAWRWALPGGLLGLVALARPEYLLFALVFAVLAAVRVRRDTDWKTGMRAAGALAAAFAIVILPWMVRDYVSLHRVVPISTGGGKALFIGTFLPGDGDHFKTKIVLYHRFYPRSTLPDGKILGTEMAPLLDRVARRYPNLSRDGALARIGRQNLRDDITDHPLDYVAMLGRKIGHLWHGSGRYMRGVPAEILQWALVAFGIAGLILLAVRRRWEGFVIGSVVLGVTLIGALLLAGTRRNVALMPLVIVLASVAVASILSRCSWPTPHSQ